MRLRCTVLLLAVLPIVASAAGLSTAQRLELLERRVDRITNLTLQLDEVRGENRQLRGEIESLGHQIEQLKRKQRDIYLDIDQRLSAMQAGGGGVAVQQPAASSGGGAPDTEAPASRQPPAVVRHADRAKIETEYQAAYALLSPQKKRYSEAAVAFSAFLERYPDDELAPNAQYWLGEAYYVTQKNADALKAFETVVGSYPGSTKVPDALYKIGKLREAAGKRDAARDSYRQVVDKHPDSSAAGLARQRLDQLHR